MTDFSSRDDLHRLKYRNTARVSAWTDWQILYRLATTSLLGPVSSVSFWHAAWVVRSDLASARSTPQSIGDTWADFADFTVALIRRMALIRLAVIVVAVIVGWLLSLSVVTIGLAVLFALFIGDRRALWVVVAIGSVPAEWSRWWIGLSYCAGMWTLFEVLSTARLSLLMRPVAPYACELFTVADRIRYARQWSQLAPALEAVFSDDTEFAATYVRRGADLDTRWASVVLAICAVTDAHNASIADAVTALEAAADLVSEGRQHRGSGAIVMLARGEVLLVADRLNEALQCFDDVVAQHRRHRNCVQVHAEKRRVQCLIGLGRTAEAVEVLAIVRFEALRRRDLPLLRWNETHCAVLMAVAGNIAGALECVYYFGDSRLDNQNVFDSPDERIARHLVAAVISREARARGIAVNDPDRTGATDADLQIELALGRLTDNAYPKYAVVAYTLWAISEWEAHGLSRVVLRRLVMAVRHSERLRVSMPSSAWRENWVAPIEFVYAQALSAAEELYDTYRMFELIELVRALPDPRSRPGIAPALALVQAAMALPLPSAAVGPSEALDEAVSLRVGGFSAVRASERRSIELIEALTTVHDDASYLALALVDNTLWWAVLIQADLGRYRAVVATGRVAVDSGTPRGDLAELFRSVPVEAGAEVADDGMPSFYSGPLMTDTGPSGQGAECDLLRRVSAIVLPDELRAVLQELVAAGQRRPLVIGATGILNAIPFAGLPIDVSPLDGPDDFVQRTRLVEVADIIHVPAWASVRKNTFVSAPLDPGSGAPLRLAVVSPDPQHPVAMDVELPASVALLQDDVSKIDLRNELARLGRGSAATMYLSCHGSTGPDVPGLQFSDPAPLTAPEILGSQADGHAYKWPDRVIVSACESVGSRATRAATILQTDQSVGIPADREWWGFPVAALNAGARHTIVTRYPVEDMMSGLIDRELIDAIPPSARPWEALSDVQCRLLSRWRNGDDVTPLMWQAYTYIGYGQGQPLEILPIFRQEATDDASHA